MTLEVDFLPIANGSGANVESQAQYVTDLASGGSLQNGYQSGLAKSVQFNKTMRQSSMIAAAVANFIANQLQSNVLDDGNIQALITNFTNAVCSANFVIDTGVANAYVVALDPAITQRVTGLRLFVKIANANTGESTINYGAGAVPLTERDGGVLNGGELQPGAIVEMIDDGTKCQIVTGRGRLLNIQYFAVAGTYTYTPTPGTQAVIVEVQGGGGAGGGCPATGAGQQAFGPGGGSGAYGRKRITSGFSGATITVGPGGAAVAGAAGGNGGSSSFGSFVSAPGGGGGLAALVASNTLITANGVGAGGTVATGGDINLTGQPGRYALYMGTGTSVSGEGGRSQFGSGAEWVTANSAGNAAVNPGSGGSGASIGAGAGATAGGNGAPGIVIVWEYA